ncbi:MAG: alginate lyase [Gammaproteobacteria bacterium]|nr:alginate lyase [Gammaproteobacteria bacterium]MYH85173.1 alginate lyase [Gammaproteobacteria bacterium]MYK05192.1 alginate lyase [Gammaproteobacteria bacterium]
MKMNQKLRLIPFTVIAALVSCAPDDDAQLVRTMEEFDQAVAMLQPGDQVVLANGVWTDVEFKFRAEGLPEQPIELKAEEPGKVIITGQSNLGISGEHIVVSGLVFRDGFTPTSEVISFRTSSQELANHTRVTNTVIDNFSNPERFVSDIWVSIYGKNNRFDHNSLLNKGNSGVTLAVRLNTEDSLDNDHVIEYNYFGPRQILGSNGGETLRIGTSHYSREFSNTQVQYNYFDRTNGEHEIVSNKACGNVYRGNVFYESQGTLTMRHGHTTLVENNYFLGNRKPNTGGIRIINEYQTVRNNYLYGLTGHRFRGALVIMNGVPNSPPNRYNQVVDSVMDGNIVVDSDYIQLCAGSDEERSAVPIGSSMRDNIIMSRTNLDPFTIYDDISGISFEGNILNEEASVPISSGFSKELYSILENENGLRVPAQTLIDRISFGEVRLPVTKDETGASFYPKTDNSTEFQSGGALKVEPGVDTIVQALRDSGPGDTLVLENGEEYLMTRYAHINHPVTIKTEDGERALVRSEKSSFFIIENDGALELENLWIDGAASPDLAGNNVVSTSRYSMNRNYSLAVRNSRVTNLDVNRNFDFLKVYMSTFADSIEILDTEMSNITGSVLSLDKETDDLGIYNVENVSIKGSRFTDIQGAVANIYRGGTDESTFGPMVVIEGNEFANIGLGPQNRSAASLKFHGVQNLRISDSNWSDSAPIELFLTNGEPITVIENIVMTNTAEIRANNDEYTIENVVYQ